MAGIHQFRHRAMATHIEVRIDRAERAYAAQAAQSAFTLIDALEARLSRFRPHSEICRIASLQPGEGLRLSPETFACLAIAKRMEGITNCTFSPTAAALQLQTAMPRWSLLEMDRSIHCHAGRVEFDLGAIGKGFALDCAAELLREWECPAFLLVAGGSSILAGEPPEGLDGWSCGLGDDGAPHRLLLSTASLSGSGVAVKGSHILDPRTGQPATRRTRTWAICDTAAESDALSTAAMVLTEPEVVQMLAADPGWLILLEEGSGIRTLGSRAAALL